jgi:hypothetical protein
MRHQPGLLNQRQRLPKISFGTCEIYRIAWLISQTPTTMAIVHPRNRVEESFSLEKFVSGAITEIAASWALLLTTHMMDQHWHQPGLLNQRQRLPKISFGTCVSSKE